MRPPRFTIAYLLLLIVVLGVSFAALRSPSQLWANAWFSTALGVLTIAVLAAVYRRNRQRAYWVGFATCGWVYFLLAMGPKNEALLSPYLVTTAILDILYPRMVPPGPPPAPPPPTVIPAPTTPSAMRAPMRGRLVVGRVRHVGGFGGPVLPEPSVWERWTEPETATPNPPGRAGSIWIASPDPFRWIGHSLFCLLIAALGGVLTRHFHATRDEAEPS